ncbi:MAG: hypothetical protein AB1440_12730, partial [Pseudomonadota bacterium]
MPGLAFCFVTSAFDLHQRNAAATIARLPKSGGACPPRLEMVVLDQMQVERLEAEAVNSAKKRQPLYAARTKIFPKRASG